MKLFFQKLWAYLKHYWWLALIVVSGIFAFVFAKNKDSMMTFWKNELLFQKARHQEEIRDILAAKDKQERERAETELRYRNSVRIVEEMKTQGMAEISKEQEKEARRIVEENKDDPQKMAQQMNQLFGFEVVIPEVVTKTSP